MKKFYKQYRRGQRVFRRNPKKSFLSLTIEGLISIPQNREELRSFWEGFSGREFGAT